MDLNELLHELVRHLPVHEKKKAELHESVDAVMPVKEDGEQNG